MNIREEISDNIINLYDECGKSAPFVAGKIVDMVIEKLQEPQMLHAVYAAIDLETNSCLRNTLVENAVNEVIAVVQQMIEFEKVQ